MPRLLASALLITALGATTLACSGDDVLPIDDGATPGATAMACTPDGTSQCGADGQVYVCAGGQWVDSHACLAEESCQGGACVPTGCAPNGANQCGDDGQVDVCSAGVWIDSHDCQVGEACSEGVCVPSACVGSCVGLTCGDDGCGGNCGTCESGWSCIEGACEETGCIGSCEGKDCGDDGCGNICGVCTAGNVCNATGQCVLDDPDCVPSCEGKDCGDDGCSGMCGLCAAGNVCNADGQCVLENTECVPSCVGLVCGDDGCGGTCGTCGAGESCDNGACVADEGGCGGITYEGCCDGVILNWCEDGEVMSIDCSEGEVPSCGWLADQGFYDCGQEGAGPPEFPIDCAGGACTPNCGDAECGDDGCGGSCGMCGAGSVCDAGMCVEDAPCTPNCIGAECGDDGCGGSCGMCGAGSVCDAGSCVEEGPADPCGGITYEGCCEDGVLSFCENDVVETIDCAEAGTTCGWAETQGYYNCGEEGAGPPEHPIECGSTCVPSCEGMVCGDDGCGGTCGACGDGLVCEAGSCVEEGPCVPSCEGMMCGDDGCGGTCGACGDGLVCDAGSCVEEGPVGPCGGITYEGCCDGLTLTWCEDEEIMTIDCAENATPSCGWSMDAAFYDCGQTEAGPAEFPMDCPASCVPNCEGMVCGDDGCGGICGTCGDGTTCTAGACVEDGPCEPSCDGMMCGDDGCGGACGICGDGTTCDDGQCVDEPTTDGACTNEADVAITEAQDVAAIGQAAAMACLGAADVNTCVTESVSDQTGLSDACASCYGGLVVCIIANCILDCAADPAAEACETCQVESGCLSEFEACSGLSEEPECVSTCDGVMCGDDGCGGTCGSCGDGETCDDGQCVEEPTPEGTCTNPSDTAITEDQDVAALAQEIALGCLATADVPTCVAEGLTEQTGLSEECSNCYGDLVICALAECLTQCVVDGESDECQECQAVSCLPAFEECANSPITVEPEPEPEGMSCTELNSCMGDCEDDDEACQDACDAAAAPASVEMFDTAIDCLLDCADDGICAAENCADLAAACLYEEDTGEGDCAGLFACNEACADDDDACFDACFDASSAEGYTHWAKSMWCASGECADATSQEEWDVCVDEALVGDVCGGYYSSCTDEVPPEPETGVSCAEVSGCIGDCESGDIVCEEECMSGGTTTAQGEYSALTTCIDGCGDGLECVLDTCADEGAACFWEGEGSLSCMEVNGCASACPAGDSDCNTGCLEEGTESAQQIWLQLIWCSNAVCAGLEGDEGTDCANASIAAGGQCTDYAVACGTDG